jgi:hypothetical protein
MTGCTKQKVKLWLCLSSSSLYSPANKTSGGGGGGDDDDDDDDGKN